MAYLWKLKTGSLPAAMNARDGISGAVLNGKMYAIGGWSSGSGWGTSYNTVLYSTDGATWTASVKTPTWSGRHAFPVVVHNGRIFVLGGDSNSGIYQPDVHSWSGLEVDDWVVEDTDAPWGDRCGHYGFSFNGYIYVGGGQTMKNVTAPPSAFFKDLWRSATGENGTWEKVTDDCPLGIRCFIMGSPPEIDGEVYFIGGGTYDTTDFTAREYKNDVFAMDENHNFRCVSHGKGSPLTKQHYHSVTALDGDLFVFGGYDGTDERTAFISTDKGKTWESMGTPPWSARHAAVSITYDGSIYFGTGMFASDMWCLEKFGDEPGMHYGSFPNGGSTALSSVYTVIDRSSELIAGKTVDEIGMYRNTPGAMTLKIAKQTGPTTLEIIYSQSVYHNGGGYQDFDITDFVVPNDGAVYRIGAAFSTPSADTFRHSGTNGRWLKVGDLTGVQTMSLYADGSYCFRWQEKL